MQNKTSRNARFLHIRKQKKLMPNKRKLLTVLHKYGILIIDIRSRTYLGNCSVQYYMALRRIAI